MKKYLLLGLACLLCLTGCLAPNQCAQSEADAAAITDADGNALQENDLSDHKHYFIGDTMYRACDPVQHVYVGEPAFTLLQSAQQLTEQIREEDAAALSRYDDAFFKKSDLLVVYLETTSGGNRYGLSRLERDDAGLMHLELTLLVDGDTNDTGNWQIAIPVSKGTLLLGEQIAYRELPYGITTYQPLPGVQYFRAGVGNDEYKHDQTNYYLTSVEDAKKFIKEYLSPHVEEVIAYYETLDDAFFAAHDLLIVPVTEGSGSNRHEVIDLTENEDGGVTLTVLRLIPSAGTCDMAYHQIIVPVEKGLLQRSDDLTTKGVTVELPLTRYIQLPLQ